MNFFAFLDSYSDSEDSVCVRAQRNLFDTSFIDISEVNVTKFSNARARCEWKRI